MTHELFREFVIRLASQIGVEVARDQIESPLQFAIGEQRVILDQDVSTQSPELIIHAEIGRIDERRELEVMRMLLEGNYLWSQTGGATLGVNSQTREVVLAWKAPLSAIPTGQVAGDVLAHFLTIAGAWAAYLDGEAFELPDQDDEPAPGIDAGSGLTAQFIRV
jgi:hypothetical protein